jgi:hypothetical protein
MRISKNFKQIVAKGKDLGYNNSRAFAARAAALAAALIFMYAA